MTAPQQDPAPYGAPDGAEVIGVVHLYDRYDETRAARIADPGAEDAREAFRVAQADLAAARAHWRGVREWAAAVAYNEWAAANPEVAAQIEADRAAAAAAEE